MPTNGRPELVEGVVSFWDPHLCRWACLLCWTPPSFPAETCGARSALDLFCTREPGHEAAHTACSSERDHHPFEIWED